ncbi:GNAT family N-acetyltransferase [Williamsia deligens]|uniref:Uncharacterized protein n=1 Tax=Williamsia deligens TaxID=321325 RepID=A0ABW3G9V2_9NOCA|nr:hypothetical protein [Williamsia deligens]MCP2196172.1 hypothetical protein [Williamsia deligens]
MDPVEINAGAWYLRALRDDERVTDVPALAALTDPDVLDGDTPQAAVVRAAQGWHDGTRLTWAVCVPTTGELIALVVLLPDPSTTTARMVTGVTTVEGAHDALAAATAAVGRFADGALGLTVVE